ncbi:hypothetical protein N0V83_001784 [Neocucurbitaria cava]|uniref:Uncharacterized protein n=1 Tax=Neocucurbitaria cava TaxID=798079 RepID=A0A9W8YFV4_9PLEO|nr:hypothetical protein N0V83_001784 [Neocucurbitaria cava]
MSGRNKEARAVLGCWIRQLGTTHLPPSSGPLYLTFKDTMRKLRVVRYFHPKSDMHETPPRADGNDGSHKHHVATTLNYWDDPKDGSRPAPIYLLKGRVTNKRPHRAHKFLVTDISGDEDKYSLDGHGFQYCSYESHEKEFIDEQAIRSNYYEECEKLVKDVTGATRVWIFNHKVRRGPTQWHHLGFNNVANRGPVTRTHVDQSYAGAELRLRHEFPGEADELLKKRYQIINIWRPIETILKDPIAVADANTVPDADLVGADMVESDFSGESWVVRHNPTHRWCYKHQMTPQDVLFIKCFDSNTTVARRALHSAFEDPAYRDMASRQSIEVRCLVFYDA